MDQNVASESGIPGSLQRGGSQSDARNHASGGHTDAPGYGDRGLLSCHLFWVPDGVWSVPEGRHAFFFYSQIMVFIMQGISFPP